MNDLTLSDHNIFLLISLINVIPIIIIYFLIPITILRRYQSLLTILLSFASGGLMADVFLRLLPYIIISYNNSIDTQSQSHVHHQHDQRVGLFILVGIFLSFMIEKFFRYLQSMLYNERHSDKKLFFYSKDDDEPAINILAYLFLLVNVLHNYANALNLTAIFLRKSTTNSTEMITTVIYKILHVFYGYAILIYSGWTSAKAMRFQFLTGLIGSILCVISLQFESNLLVKSWPHQILLPIIAGIFVYISTAHIIPEVIENKSGLKGTILKVNAFIISVLIIFYLKKYEDSFT